MRKTENLPWSEKWSQLYEEEAIRLIEIFEQELIGIHHIGSSL